MFNKPIKTIGKFSPATDLSFSLQLVAVMLMAPSLRFATLKQDSVNADLMCRDGGAMNVR